MFRRIAVLAVAVAAAVVTSGSPASASCLDDFLASDPFASDEQFNGSDHWLNWVHVQGVATVTFEGDDLLYDVGEVTRLNVARVEDYTRNVSGSTTGFVDCVAG